MLKFNLKAYLTIACLGLVTSNLTLATESGNNVQLKTPLFYYDGTVRTADLMVVLTRNNRQDLAKQIRGKFMSSASEILQKAWEKDDKLPLTKIITEVNEMVKSEKFSGYIGSGIKITALRLHKQTSAFHVLAALLTLGQVELAAQLIFLTQEDFNTKIVRTPAIVRFFRQALTSQKDRPFDLDLILKRAYYIAENKDWTNTEWARLCLTLKQSAQMTNTTISFSSTDLLEPFLGDANNDQEDLDDAASTLSSSSRVRHTLTPPSIATQADSEISGFSNDFVELPIK